MKIDEILEKLPESCAWMVLFNLTKIRTLADEATIKKMYFLNEAVDLPKFSHVVLTSQGRYVAPIEGNTLTHGEELIEYDFNGTETLGARYKHLLDEFALNNADSLAVAVDNEYGDVCLYIQIDNATASAQSVFTKAPSKLHYELLNAVGVTYLSGEVKNNRFVATYQNSLPLHIQSAIFADFSRTDNCNYFFFKHGNIDQFLSHGLSMAADSRLNKAILNARAELEKVALRSLNEKLAMSWLPPDGGPTMPFGDLVPMGFVNAALKDYAETKVQPLIEKRLIDKKLRGLWTFESDDLETSTDSSLVLHSMNDVEAAGLIQKFSDGKGGYFPQLWALNPQAGEMPYVREKRHWCQSDFASTCLAYASRRRLGYEKDAATEAYLKAGYESRSGLYYANPFFIDWIYALALNHCENADALKLKLRSEVLAALQAGYYVNNFDRVLSTAYACLALKETGYTGRTIKAMQIYVMNNFERERNGKNIPFYSSLINDQPLPAGRLANVNGYQLSVSFHEDTYDMIYLSAVCMALNIQGLDSNDAGAMQNYIAATPNERYNCPNHLQYIQNFALVPYVKDNLPEQ